MTSTEDTRLRALLDTLFAAHPWHGIDPGDPAGVMTAYIEIVPTDAVKYELDKQSGALRIDRPHRSSSLAPMPYGFVPQTYCGTSVAARCAERTSSGPVEGDHDPMDVCVLTEKPLEHGGFLARVRPIGGLRMIDGNEADDKIVAVLENDLAWGALRELTDCPPESSSAWALLPDLQTDPRRREAENPTNQVGREEPRTRPGSSGV